MFTLDDGQKLYLQSRARFALIKVEENKGQKEEWRVGPIVEALHEVCAMGYSIAMDDVCSTPWEMLIVRLFRDTGRGTQETATDVVDARMAEGWEPWNVCGPFNSHLIMRRRRAVREILAAKKSLE